MSEITVKHLMGDGLGTVFNFDLMPKAINPSWIPLLNDHFSQVFALELLLADNRHKLKLNLSRFMFT